MRPRKKRNSEKTSPLRERAEQLVQLPASHALKTNDRDVQALIRDLQVHEIELELQNEELREAQLELIESRNHYSELYDFAPVGYVTLDENNKVLDCNLTAASMLGVQRQVVLGKGFSKFVSSEYGDQWHIFSR